MLACDGQRAQVKDSVEASFSHEDRKFKEMMARYRSGYPKLWRRGSRTPQPWVWFRARLLHTLMPSDDTFWSVVDDPVVWTIRLLMTLPVVSVVLVCTLFVAIRKRDE